MYKNALKDCLHNVSKRENRNPEIASENALYYRGLTVGIVSALMYRGASFERAIEIIKENMPTDPIDPRDFLHPAWVEMFEKQSG